MSDFVTFKGLNILIDNEPVIYYANALNGAPAIRGLLLQHTNAAAIEDLRLELIVTSLGVELSHVFKQRITTLPGSTEMEVPIRVHWDANALWNLTEEQPADIEVRIFQDEDLIHETVFPLQVASPSHWRSNGSNAETVLAAYVQPNHPAVTEVIKIAAEILKSRGIKPSFSGYQEGPAHVLQIVEALWDAVKSMKIAYSNPPASWGLPGQKIRSAEQIIENKTSTCLDSSVFFASILENVGIAPVISLVPQHAWVGFWMVDPVDGLPFNQSVNPMKEVISYADLEKPYIYFLEGNLLCDGDRPGDFQTALKTGLENVVTNQTLSANSGDSGVVDIFIARNYGAHIVPMPARVINADGSVSIVEYKPAEFSYNKFLDELSVAMKDKGKSANLLDTQLPPRLKKWLDSLLDLSMRNPLINFRARTTSVPLVMPKGTVAQLEDMLTAGISFQILTIGEDQDGRVQDIGDDRGQDAGLGDKDRDEIAAAFTRKQVFTRFSAKDSVTRMRRMVSNAKTMMEETGSNSLYLALGELVWVPDGKLEIRSPLLLVPVILTPKNRSREFHLSIDESSQITPNYSLVQKFKQDLGIDLTMLTDLAQDDSGIDVPGTFEAVRQKLVEASLAGFRVDETATLGFFNFSSYRLWRDLIDNWKIFEKNPLVKHLIYTPNMVFEDPEAGKPITDLDDLVAKLPIEADSSQALAVAKALNGETFVLQGPPGTGKSQTITNLLARALHEGKRVLFVAEKKDALDVVKERLDKVGLGDFSLDLHDKAMSPKFVKQQLLNAVAKEVKSDKVGYETNLEAYDQAVRPLIEYRNRLHESKDLGQSLYSALDNYLVTPGEKELPISGDFLAAATEDLRRSVVEWIKTVARLGGFTGTLNDSEWFISNLGTQTPELQTVVRDTLHGLQDALAKVSADPLAQAFIANSQSYFEIDAAQALSVKALPQGDLAQMANATNLPQVQDAIAALENLLKKTSAIPYDLARAKQIDFNAERVNLAEARGSNVFTRGGKLSKIVLRINALMGVEVVSTPDELDIVLSGLEDAIKAENTAVIALNRVPGLRMSPTLNVFNSNETASIIAELKNLEIVSKFLKFDRNGSTTELVKASGEQPGRFEALVQFSALLGKLFTSLRVTPETIAVWQRGQAFGSRLIQALPVWFEDSRQHDLVQFGRFVELNQVLSQLRSVGLGEAVNEIVTGKVPYAESADAFNKGYYKALFSKLMVGQGFTTFDGMTNNNYLARLAESKDKLQEVLPSILAAELKSRHGISINDQMGAKGDLTLALKAKRSPAIRKLLARHWDIISTVTPCVLASPDSTVRFIDADLTPFDLVVFDEASQIKVANSIGALGRGKASIVVGDSKQMPPTSVAQTKNAATEDDSELTGEEELNGTDAESILDQSTDSGVPAVSLDWHYRSEDESLIAFSNQNYYLGRLNTFPNPSEERESKGLKFVYVEDGHFVRPREKGESPVGTNHKEAIAIVDEIARRAKDPELRNYSIGVVTFNQQQQQYISDLLMNSNDKDIQDAIERGFGGEEILIKNLETVQGSERDVILFSVAFSKEPGGKELPTRFGPLNQDGGERRLNVAITRAKRQVIVFASFTPAELKARKSDKVGVQDLAKFMTIAENRTATQVLNVSSELDVDRHRTQILKTLKAAGLSAIEDMGLSGFKVDLAVYDPADPSKAILGILLDGPRWNSRSTVNDRDLLPVNVLEKKMGWPLVERIWLPTWIRDEAGEVARIQAAFAKALEISKQPRVREVKPDLVAQRKAAEAEAPVDEETPETKAATTTNTGSIKRVANNQTEAFAEFVSQHIWFKPAEQTRAGKQSDLDLVFDKKIMASIRQLVALVTATEGPCHPSRVASFVGGAFGYERVVAKRVNEILSVKFPGHKTDDEGFFYPSGADPDEYKGFSISPQGAFRPIGAISLIELANAMSELATFTQGSSSTDLTRNTALLFGFQKISAAMDERLNEALVLGLSTDRLVQRGEYIHGAN